MRYEAQGQYVINGRLVFGHRIRVFFNGEVHRTVVACNPEEGWIEYYLTDKEGKLLDTNGEFTSTREYGQVRIEVIR